MKKGYIICSNCGSKKSIENYILNVNGRYKRVCRACRTNQVVNSRRKRDMSSYYKDSYKKNIHIHTWRNLLRNYLNRKNIKKSDSTLNLLKYSHIELKEHIESLFTSCMCWDNYGDYWQIDHIIPVSAFKPETPPSVVNSLENLRPLCKLVNNKKGNKMVTESNEILFKYKTYMKDEYIKEKI